MRFPRDDGSVLAADLVLASAIVVVVAAIAGAFGTIAGTTQDNREAARSAAVMAARTGDMPEATSLAERLAPGSIVTIDDRPDEVMVRVAAPIEVPHPVLHRVELTVIGEATVPVAPYRSNRG